MKMLARGLAALGLIVVTAAGAEVRNVHFALTASIAEGTSLAGTGMLIGIGTRVDFELKGPFAVSPEIDWFQYWGPLVPACILNCRFGKGYLGMVYRGRGLPAYRGRTNGPHRFDARRCFLTRTGFFEPS